MKKNNINKFRCFCCDKKLSKYNISYYNFLEENCDRYVHRYCSVCNYAIMKAFLSNK